MTAARVELELSGPMDHLRITWQVGESLIETVPFEDDPDGTRYNTLLAVQEMVTNVLRHAHGLDEDLAIRATFVADEDSFVVQLQDQGEPFDPRTYTFREPDLMPTAVGGFGIMIATAVMDRLEYRREGDWNVLTMTKLAKARERTVAGAEG